MSSATETATSGAGRKPATAEPHAATRTTAPRAGAAAEHRDVPRSAPRLRRSGISVRLRIAATVALLVAVALGAAGLLVYAIEYERLEARTSQDVEQELDEFVKLSGDGTDPRTGKRFTSVERVLELFMQRNVPDDDELLVGWVGDGPVNRSQLDPLAHDPAFVAAARPLVTSGGTTRMSTDRGEVMITAQPVRRGPEHGALVVVIFLAEDRAELLDTMRTYAIVAALSMLAITAIAYRQSGRLLAPLRLLRGTADEINESDMSRRIPLSGNDDITALTRTVNGMLDRIEAAFQGQRHFLDDAGHELRTPLTVVRGHLELLDPTDPGDVEETRALLLDEVDRMSRLVGDLILLAKSDRPDFVVPAPVDLAELTEDVLAKARALGERRWVLDAEAEGVVLADRQRLTQAMLQLADNAVKHTTAEDTIGIGSSYDGATVRLWVRDTGPGVPEADRALVFERFGRSRVPAGDEGFGLGLSIVHAIATAHGGDVLLEDEQPHGARLVLRLPASAPAGSPTEVVPWPAS